ncbi:WD40 repeat domain-containing protein [Nonomuraea antimicrobica]
MTTTVVDGQPVVVTGGDDHSVRLWDLTSGKPFGQPLMGHDGPVRTLATAVVDDRAVAVTGGDDCTVRIWDLAAGKQLGAPLTGHTAAVRSVATTSATGQPLAVTAGTDKTVRVWNVATGEQIGAPGVSHRRWVRAVDTAMLDGTPVSVAGSFHGGLQVRELATNRQISTSSPRRHGPPVQQLATTVVGGQPVALTTSDVNWNWGEDVPVKLWEVTTGRHLGDLPAVNVQALTAASVCGHPVAVTASGRAVEVWDLTTHRQIGPRLYLPDAATAIAVDEAGHIVVCFRSGIAVFRGE